MIPDYGRYKIEPPPTEEELNAQFDAALAAGDERFDEQKDEELNREKP